MEPQPSKAFILDTFQRAGKRVSVHCQVWAGCRVFDMKAPLRQVAKGLENKGTWKEFRYQGNREETQCENQECVRTGGGEPRAHSSWPHGIVA